MRYASRDPGTHVLHPGLPTSPELDAAAAAMAVAAAVHLPLSHPPRWDLTPRAAHAQKHELATKLQEKKSTDKDRRNSMQRFESYASAQQDTYSDRSLSVRSSLPPTPPQQIGEDMDEPLRSPSLFSDIYHSAVASPSMFVGSPIHLTGPPTPDTTPPRRDRMTVSRRDIARHPSQTDSFLTFVTARETMHSQTSDRSQAFLAPSMAGRSLQASRQQSPTPSTSTAVAPIERDTSVTTPVPQPGGSRLRHAKRNSPESKTRSRHNLDPDSAPGALDGHLQITSDSRDHLGEFPSSSSPSPQRKPRHGQRAGSGTAATPSSQSLLEQAAQDTAASHDALYNHLRDEKSKRLSAHSGSSTVVEAMVVVTPPKPHRNLRHAGRNLALRSVAHNRAASRRSSSDSYDSSAEHHLRHQRSPLPGRGFGAGRLGTSDVPQRAVSDSAALKRSRNYSTQDPEPLIAPLSFRGLSKPAKRLSAFSTRAVMPELEHLALSSEEEEDDDDDVPMHYGFENVRSRRKAMPQSHQGSTKHDRSASDALLRVSASARTPPTAVTFAAVESKAAHGRKDSAHLSESKTPVQANSGMKSIGDGGLLASPTRGPVHSRRGSLEPPTEHGHKRYPSLSYTPLSELSQWSDRTHNAEVVTATAINIYPHHNESVLVIQQHTNAGGPAEEQTERAQGSLPPPPREKGQQPSFRAIVHEGTPPPTVLTDRDRTVDSPLLNPRAAPEPPVFKFIPPTPNDEEDRQLGAEPNDARPFSMNATEALPTRKLSLREKAAVQGSSILDAIFLRQPSIRRRYVVSSNVDESQRRNLHPFWRPRGFWDDFDSEEEEEDFADDEPLPRGGDTSNEEPTILRNGSKRLSFPRKMSTRLPGFRGSGGFLIGNSLGIGRHGTNNRRPYVSVPLHLQQSKAKETQQYSSVPRHGPAVVRSALSSDSLSRRSGRVLKSYRVPGVGTVNVRGLYKIKESIRRVRETRAEKAAEKRREHLRGMIGMRISHNT